VSHCASVVIPFYGAFPYLRACLLALASHAGDVPREVVVVNDGWPDRSGLRDLAARAWPFALRLVDRRENRGFAYTCNEGASVASSDWLVFLNVDTLPQEGWLTSLLELPRREPDAAVVGARLLYPGDESVQHVGGCFDDHGTPHHVYLRQRGDLPFVRRDRRVQWVTGACMALERTTFAALGGFDVEYGTYSEDADLCFAARYRGGGAVWVAGASVVHHFEGVSDVPSARKLRTLERLRAKWGAFIRLDEYDLYASDGFSRAWLELADSALLPRDFAFLSEVRDALGLGSLDAQAQYASERGPDGLLADVRRLRRSGRVQHGGSRRAALSVLFRQAHEASLPRSRQRAFDAALAAGLHAQHVDLYAYNLGSLLAKRGQHDMAAGLLRVVAEVFGKPNPDLAGKAAFKLSCLAASRREERQWLLSALRLCPTHRAAAARLAALEARSVAADEAAS
jgi:GT2 family glycosyltransferase